MHRQRYLIGIDAGSSKVCASVGCTGKDSTINVLAVACGRSHGLKNGMVIDLADATESIRAVIEELEMHSGIKVRSAIVGMGGDHIHGQNTRGVITVSDPEGEIRRRDMRHAIELAQTMPMPLERKPIHTISQGFVIDGLEGVSDPRQMHGSRLEAHLHIITAIVSRVRNVTRCIHGAGLTIEKVAFTSLASSYSVLTPEEKRLGVTMIDLGGGTTTILAFAEGKIKHTEVIPWGGDNLTDVIARHFKISGDTAERLKERYGSVVLEPRRQEENVYWSGEETEGGIIKRGKLTEVIRTEIEDLLKNLKEKLESKGCIHSSPYGLVLTGGTSILDGVLEFTEEKLGLPVRLGLPRGFKSEEQISNPGYSGSLGLLRFSLENRDTVKINPFSWFIKVFEDYF